MPFKKYSNPHRQGKFARHGKTPLQVSREEYVITVGLYIDDIKKQLTDYYDNLVKSARVSTISERKFLTIISELKRRNKFKPVKTGVTRKRNTNFGSKGRKTKSLSEFRTFLRKANEAQITALFNQYMKKFHIDISKYIKTSLNKTRVKKVISKKAAPKESIADLQALMHKHASQAEKYMKVMYGKHSNKIRARAKVLYDKHIAEATKASERVLAITKNRVISDSSKKTISSSSGLNVENLGENPDNIRKVNGKWSQSSSSRKSKASEDFDSKKMIAALYKGYKDKVSPRLGLLRALMSIRESMVSYSNTLKYDNPKIQSIFKSSVGKIDINIKNRYLDIYGSSKIAQETFAKAVMSPKSFKIYKQNRGGRKGSLLVAGFGNIDLLDKYTTIYETWKKTSSGDYVRKPYVPPQQYAIHSWWRFKEYTGSKGHKVFRNKQTEAFVKYVLLKRGNDGYQPTPIFLMKKSKKKSPIFFSEDAEAINNLSITIPREIVRGLKNKTINKVI